MKKKSYNFEFSLPPTLNNTYKISGNRMYKSQEAIDWQEVVGWEIKSKHIKLIKEEVFVGISMFLKRDRDIDSSLKLILDTLADVGVYKNDSQVISLRVEKFVDKINPRMEVLIFEVL